MKSVALDPSINNVGWSVFNSAAKARTRAWKWGTFYLAGGSFEMRLTDLRQQMDEKIGGFDFLITEKPAFFSSERGQIAARQNYTIDLAAVNYYIAGWYRMDHRNHFAITANQWKGSVPKEVTARRFFKRFPEVNPNSLSEHAIDSIMMHRWWLDIHARYLPKSLWTCRGDLSELIGNA